jgi:hypothetical protein
MTAEKQITRLNAKTERQQAQIAKLKGTIADMRAKRAAQRSAKTASKTATKASPKRRATRRSSQPAQASA